MLFTAALILGSLLVGLVLGIADGGVRVQCMTKKLEKRNDDLEAELAKLSAHILWMTGDRSLGGEIDMRQIPDRLSEPPPKDEIDRLLDALEHGRVTKITRLKNKDVGILHFGVVCLRDQIEGEEAGAVCLRDQIEGEEAGPERSVLRGGGRREPRHLDWRPDIVLDGILLPRLTSTQQERARRIFRDKMAGEAIGKVQTSDTAGGTAVARGGLWL
jgi:hypothetical protein